MKNMEDKVLEVHMLGGFTLNYCGTEIVLGKNSTAKYIQLLQIVWLHGKNGITKEELMRCLFERESLSNLSNSFNNLLYQMRRKVVQAGLPEGRYIDRGGLLCPDQSIAVEVDAVKFEELAEKAEREDDEKEKYRYYSEAIGLYQGELLPELANETWVIAKSIHYKTLFAQSIRWMGEYLKNQRDYDEMYRIYSKAAEIYPYDDWQIYQIDSLLCKGEYKNAYQLYDKTIRAYSDEMGLPPSEHMLECYRNMSQRLTGHEGDILDIEVKLKEEEWEEEQRGAYYCSYPSFIDTYRLLSRNMERTGNSIFLMLCTLTDYEGKLIQNQEKLKKRSEDMRQAIRCSLRKSDAYTRYNMSQYLILLVDTMEENCYMISRRISKKLKEISGPRAEFTYEVVSLAELPEPQ